MLQRLRNAILWLMNWRTRRFWFVVAVGFPVAYVLSYGLFVRACYQNLVLTSSLADDDTLTGTFECYTPPPGAAVFETTFAPINLIVRSSSKASELHDAYKEFWMPSVDGDRQFEEIIKRALAR